MRLINLHNPGASDVIQAAGSVLVASREQQTTGIDGDRSDRTALQRQRGRGRHDLNGLGRPQVPEAARLVLRAAHENVLGAGPAVQRVNVSGVSAVAAQTLLSLTVQHVDLAVAGTAANQYVIVLLLHEDQVPDRSVVVSQLHLEFQGLELVIVYFELFSL